MELLKQDDLRNTLLRALPPATFAALGPLLERVDLPSRFRLMEADQEPDWAYFPESGVASIVGRLGDTWQEVGLFGREGTSCLVQLCGTGPSPFLILMQVGGKGHRFPMRTVHRAFETDAGLRAVILGFAQAFQVQLAQTCIANCQFATVQRLARWFLLIHDRVDDDTITVTHEFIATMLGVGRTGVTLALHTLEEAGLIGTGRRRVTVLDRPGLERVTDGTARPGGGLGGLPPLPSPMSAAAN